MRVLVVDDHEVFATSLGRALAAEEGIDVVGAVGTAAEARRVAGEGVDVVLCDYRLRDGDGATLATELRAACPDLEVVMLTASEDDAVLFAAIEAGCCGFVTKVQPLDDVVDAVRAASAGESIISPAMLARLLPRMGRAGSLDADVLTARELEVLRVMAYGGSNQAIADELFVSRDTIRNHVSSILRKLGAHSKLEAVAVAARRGIIQVG